MTNEKLRQQLAERERAAQLSQQMRVRSTLGERASQALPYGQAGGEIEEPQLRALIAEIENVYKALREMAAAQGEEAEAQAREDVQLLQNFMAAVQQRAGRPRSLSPTRDLSASRSGSQLSASQRGFGRQLPGQSLADQTVAAVQQAYNKRQQQVGELRAHWAQTRELIEGVKKYVIYINHII